MSIIFTIIPVMIIVVTVRAIYVLYQSGKPLRTTTLKPVSTLIVLGSGAAILFIIIVIMSILGSSFICVYNVIGGHTAEMLNLVVVLQKEKFMPRYYVAAATDNMSLQKAQALEESLVLERSAVKKIEEASQFMQIYRSREVGQSYLTSVGTTLIAMVNATWLIFKIRPQVILCNGPGTCVPLCVAAFLLKVVGIRWSSIFYIESIARVRKLSLSGLLLYKLRIADQFCVQWPQLQRQYQRAHYVGRLM